MNNYSKYIKWYEDKYERNEVKPARKVESADSMNKIKSINNPQYDVNFIYERNNKKISKAEYIKINDEFKALNDEVSNILAKEARPKSTAKLAKINKNITSANSKTAGLKSPNTFKETKMMPATTYNINPSINNTMNKIKPNSAVNHFRETMMKKKAEEEMVRLAIERRNKEYQRECIEKMTDANIINDELDIPKSYSAFSDANDGKILCRVFEKDTKKTIDIDFKMFLVEYKKLLKLKKVLFFIYLYSKKNLLNTIERIIPKKKIRVAVLKKKKIY
jgi:hypothetical protein